MWQSRKFTIPYHDCHRLTTMCSIYIYIYMYIYTMQ